MFSYIETNWEPSHLVSWSSNSLKRLFQVFVELIDKNLLRKTDECCSCMLHFLCIFLHQFSNRQKYRELISGYWNHFPNTFTARHTSYAPGAVQISACQILRQCWSFGLVPEIWQLFRQGHWLPGIGTMLAHRKVSQKNFERTC